MESFYNYGPLIWLASGASTSRTLYYSYGHGAVYIQPNCVTPYGQMMTTAQGVEGDGGGPVTYSVWFQNNGPEPCCYNLNFIVGGIS